MNWLWISFKSNAVSGLKPQSCHWRFLPGGKTAFDSHSRAMLTVMLMQSEKIGNFLGGFRDHMTYESSPNLHVWILHSSNLENMMIRAYEAEPPVITLLIAYNILFLVYGIERKIRCEWSVSASGYEKRRRSKQHQVVLCYLLKGKGGVGG